MKLEEYKDKLIQIKRKYDKEMEQLQEEYALSNNPYKVGDIIEDHVGRIEIQGIGILYESVPSCRYYGPEVRKADNAIKKSGSKRYVYQCNVIKKIERV